MSINNFQTIGNELIMPYISFKTMKYFFSNSIVKAGLVMLFICSIAAAMVYYQKTFSMEVINSMEINDPSLEAKVLVTAQGSAYKKEVVATVVDAFRESEVFIKVMDVTKLTDEDPSKWDAIVILHTWEMWKPQIKPFISKISEVVSRRSSLSSINSIFFIGLFLEQR